MSEEEVLSLNNYLEDLYQAMQIGDIVFESKRSSELYNLINKLLKENQELKNQQKEFIEYLENEIQKQKDYGASFGLFIDRDISEHISEKIETCQDFLSKYKEIMEINNE